MLSPCPCGIGEVHLCLDLWVFGGLATWQGLLALYCIMCQVSSILSCRATGALAAAHAVGLVPLAEILECVAPSQVFLEPPPHPPSLSLYDLERILPLDNETGRRAHRNYVLTNIHTCYVHTHTRARACIHAHTHSLFAHLTRSHIRTHTHTLTHSPSPCTPALSNLPRAHEYT